MKKKLLWIGGILLFPITIYCVVKHFFKLAVCRDAKLPEQGMIDPNDPYQNRIKKGITWYDAQRKERAYITSHDGLKLAADIILADESNGKKAKGAILLVHGFRGSSKRDFGCVGPFYHGLGYHMICPHQRASGDSEGEYITFGIMERLDCKLWAEYVAKRFGEDCPIIMDGISMGASTVLMAAGLDLPKNVCCAIADSGFTSPKEIMATVMKNWFHMRPFPFLYLTDWYCRKHAGFGFGDCSTYDAMKKCNIPILFIHGEADDFVPCEMSRQSYEWCVAPKEIVTVAEAGHGFSYLVEEQKVTDALLGFFEKYVPKRD